jgi:hypothetical protein
MPYDQVMPKWKAGILRSSSGQPVTDQKQAVAIMLSEKRAAEAGKEEDMPKHERLMREAVGRRKKAR